VESSFSGVTSAIIALPACADHPTPPPLDRAPDEAFLDFLDGVFLDVGGWALAFGWLVKVRKLGRP